MWGLGGNTSAGRSYLAVGGNGRGPIYSRSLWSTYKKWEENIRNSGSEED